MPADHRLAARARGYAAALFTNIETAAAKHVAMRAAAIRLYAIAEHGLLDPGQITRELLAIGRGMSWPERRLTDLLDWSRAQAVANPELPKAFR